MKSLTHIRRKKFLNERHSASFAAQAIFFKLAQPHGFENKFSAICSLIQESMFFHSSFKCLPLVALNNYFLYKEVKPQMLKVGAHEK